MNVWTFLIHIVCAILIIFCISIWVWKPTNDFIDRQKQKLDKEKRDLVINNRETRYFLSLLKRERNEMLDTKRQIRLKAIAEAEEIKHNTKLFVENQTAEMKKQAVERIRVMEEKAKDEIKNSVVNMALELTEKLVIANLNESTNKVIVDEYIKSLEDRKLSNTKIS